MMVAPEKGPTLSRSFWKDKSGHSLRTAPTIVDCRRRGETEENCGIDLP
jgi:hypothetical protein